MATGLFNLKQVNQAISQGAWSGYIAPKWVEYLVVAGGAGGSNGAGGGGGLLSGIVTVAAGTSYTVTVGAGGSDVAGNGSNSVFGNIASTGGGGGTNGDANGKSGGSGGGAGYGGTWAVGQGTAGQGSAGGLGAGTSGTDRHGGGGGGAGTIGGNATTTLGGFGGAGIASAISGSVVTYSGGGGGGGGVAGGAGGVGGGGTGSTGKGTAGGGNTGGGGGGGYATGGGAGGSGIVVVRYPGSIQFFTGGTLSYANGYMIHTFYASGTLAPTTPTPYVTDYQISRSLRFNAADTAYLSRTPSSATNRKTWTWSAWVKRSNVSTQQFLFGARVANSTPYGLLGFGADGVIQYLEYVSGAYVSRTTVPVFRDASAWYHIVFVYDTTQTDSLNRIKLYVNNVQQTFNAWSGGSLAQNYDGFVNSANLHVLGYNPNYGESFNGYMTEVNFIDGQALTPSSFGYTNPSTGVWSPLAFVGTYGTNGFYLNFSDNSNTTAATLGKDYSGNGNNWTPNNFSVTAGSGNDSLVDSPTSYGTDTGVGGTVRGNYATINPLDGVSVGTPSNGNLDFTVSTATGVALGTMAISSGKWYWEVVGTGGDATYMIGVANANASASTKSWQGANGWFYYNVNGNKYTNGSSASYGSIYGNNTVIGVALDMDAGTLTFYRDGVSQGVAYSVFSGLTVQPAVSSGSTSNNYTINFGQRPFAYTAPSGFKALCTQNLPTPAIGATSTTLAGKYFNSVLYTGNASTQTITGVGFQPDLVWIKCRSNVRNHVWGDVLRGSTYRLSSNLTSAESNVTNGITAFTSDGFSLGDDGQANQLNETEVAWNWKANGSGSTNTAGSITSTVSANTTSGFSIATFTSQASGTATVGHGLGVAPSMVIVKGRNVAYEWYTYHVSLGASAYVSLSNTAASASSTTLWNATSPTSSVFSLGTAWTGSNTFVAYCFAEVAGYSKFGSYTGNGSADGPFVYCGFRPAFIMVKASSGGSASSANWLVLDNTRNTYNETNNKLAPNLSDAENSVNIGTSSQNNYDFLSNGFKARTTNGSSNENGTTFIFMALAQNPFKYSLAR